MTEHNKNFLNRSGFKPSRVQAQVKVSLLVDTGYWGQDCTIAQAVAQASENANGRIASILKDEQGIKLLGSECVKVICEAEK